MCSSHGFLCLWLRLCWGETNPKNKLNTQFRCRLNCTTLVVFEGSAVLALLSVIVFGEGQQLVTSWEPPLLEIDIPLLGPLSSVT